MHIYTIHRIFVVYGLHLNDISIGTKRIDLISRLEKLQLTEEFNFGHNLFQFYSGSKYPEKKLTMVYINDEFKVAEVKLMDVMKA
jgi:hypothetical protein